MGARGVGEDKKADQKAGGGSWNPFAALMGSSAPTADDIKEGAAEVVEAMSAAAHELLQTYIINPSTVQDIRKEIEEIFNPDDPAVKTFWESQITKLNLGFYKFFVWGQDIGDDGRVMNGIPSGVADIVIKLYQHVKKENKMVKNPKKTADLFNDLQVVAQAAFDRNSYSCKQPTRDIYRIMRLLNNEMKCMEGTKVVTKKWEENISYVHEELLEWRRKYLPKKQLQKDEKGVAAPAKAAVVKNG